MKLFFLVILAGLSIFFLVRGQEQSLESILTVLPASLRTTLGGWLNSIGDLLKPVKEVWDRFLGEEVKALLKELEIYLKAEAEYRKKIFRQEFEKEMEELRTDFKKIFARF